MTLEDLDQIDKLREKATKGPWTTDEGAVVAPASGEWVCEYAARVDAAYLAALSPEVVGELVRLARETLMRQSHQTVRATSGVSTKVCLTLKAVRDGE